VATLERTYVVSCKCESKKEKSVGFGSTMAIADIWTTPDLENSRNPLVGLKTHRRIGDK